MKKRFLRTSDEKSGVIARVIDDTDVSWPSHCFDYHDNKRLTSPKARTFTTDFMRTICEQD